LLADLAEALAARGRTVHVIAAGADGVKERNGVTIHRTGSHDRHEGARSRVANYAGFLRQARHRLATLAGPGDVVVLMTDPPLLAAAATPIARQRGARVVHWIQDIYPEIVAAAVGQWAAWSLAPLRWLRNRAWCAAARCVTVGSEMADLIAAEGVPADQTIVIANWAPTELHTHIDATTVATQRAEWGLADQFVAAYSGNFGRVHEFETLIGAAECLRAHSDIVFLLIGDGPQLPAVRAAVARRGLTNVRFLPPQPRASLAVTLAVADVHLVTLRPGFKRLVFPSKLAGVLAAGRPVLFVGPTTDEIASLLESDSCGHAVRVGDAEALAAHLLALQADRAACARLGRNARATYERHFTLAHSVAAWLAMLAAVYATPGRNWPLATVSPKAPIAN
jgi:glycosyltransferase involved in cell wall biosynthesis